MRAKNYEIFRLFQVIEDCVVDFLRHGVHNDPTRIDRTCTSMEHDRHYDHQHSRIAGESRCVTPVP